MSSFCYRNFLCVLIAFNIICLTGCEGTFVANVQVTDQEGVPIEGAKWDAWLVIDGKQGYHYPTDLTDHEGRTGCGSVHSLIGKQELRVRIVKEGFETHDRRYGIHAVPATIVLKSAISDEGLISD